MKRKTFFFVTTIRYYQNNGIEQSDSRCIGFYPSRKSARNVVIKNWKTLAEAGWYKHAVIEEFGFGWYPYESKPEE